MIAPVDHGRTSTTRDLPGRAPQKDWDFNRAAGNTNPVEMVRDIVKQHPAAAIAVGATIGLAAAMIFKRKMWS